MRYLLTKITDLRCLLSENRYLLWDFGTPLFDRMDLLVMQALPDTPFLFI